MNFLVGQQVFVVLGLGSTAEWWPGLITYAYGDGSYDVEPLDDEDNPYFSGGVFQEDQLRPLR